MNEVRFIQKIGQVPMAELVENAAKLGFVLAGSPTLVSNVPAQLMVQSDKPAMAPEYILVEKTGQLKLSTQVEQLLDEGWQIYGSMLTGEVPMQAMVRGDIGVHSMYGFDSGSEGPGPDPADWQKEIARVDENITEIYNVLNSTPSPTPEINKAREDAVKESKAYTDAQIKLIPGVAEGADAERVDKLEVRCSDMEADIQGNTQAQQNFEARIDQSMADYITEVDNKAAFFQQANVLLTKRVADLEIGLDMEANERRTDIARLEDMIGELLLQMKTLTQAMPAEAKVGTAWQ